MKLRSEREATLLENPEQGSAPEQQVHLLDVLIILANRWRFILWFTLGAAILTTIIVFLVPNKYTATTVVLPPNQNSSMSTALLGQLGGGGPLASLAGATLGMRNSADMYVSLFRSRTVEDTLIQRFGLMSRYHEKNMVDARKKFEDRTTVVLGVKDGLIRINVTDRDPNFAAQLANAYVDEFRKHTDSLTITEASQRRAFFQQQLLEANDNLTRAEQGLKKTEQSTGVLQLDSQARALIESAAVLRGQITAKEVQLQAMRSYVTEDNPQYMMAEQELDALKAQLSKVAGPGANTNADIDISKTNIPESGMEYMNNLRDVRYYETIADLIAKQFEAAKIDEARQGTLEVSDIAVPPDKKSSPHRGLIAVVTTFFSFCLASGWCIFKDRVDLEKRDPGRFHRAETSRALQARKDPPGQPYRT
jgi:tyrosine-protein kinase Etk/Wzc